MDDTGSHQPPGDPKQVADAGPSRPPRGKGHQPLRQVPQPPLLQLAIELDLEWPPDVKAHPINGFSDVQLTEVAPIFYADTIRELDEAIGLHLDAFRRCGWPAVAPPPRR
jgi:hypothetical protein